MDKQKKFDLKNELVDINKEIKEWKQGPLILNSRERLKLLDLQLKSLMIELFLEVSD